MLYEVKIILGRSGIEDKENLYQRTADRLLNGQSGEAISELATKGKDFNVALFRTNIVISPLLSGKLV